MSNLNFAGFFFLHFDSQLLRLSSQNQKYFENMEHHRKDTKPFQIRVEETVKKLEALHKPRNRLTMRKICKLFFVLSVCITLGIAMLLLLLYVWVGSLGSQGAHAPGITLPPGGPATLTPEGLGWEVL